MKISLSQALLMIIAGMLAACAMSPELPDNSQPRVEKVRYRCADGVAMSVTYTAGPQEGAAEMVWDGNVFKLKQQISGSGARYGDGTLTLFTKGDEAFVQKGTETVLRDCNVAN
jgi:membrane-bound inhibitor of C-type lysozyme